MKKIILLDGGMGQELMKRSKSAPHPLWSAQILKKEPKLVENLHIDFIKAGARVISLNTYTATPERLEREGAKEMFNELHEKAIEVANRARDHCNISDVRIAGCLPPLYGSYKPEITPSLEECIDRYDVISKKQAPYVDLFICETMSSIKEAEAAITAATSEKVETWCSLTISDQDNLLLRSHEKLKEAIIYLNRLNHEANLLNCSVPEVISASLNCLNNVAKPFGAYANGFTSVDALEIGGTVDVLKSRDDLGPEKYFNHVMRWLKTGAKIIGGCCEISPLHIEYICEKLSEKNFKIVGSL
tara:strand:+ start:831 stop:1736 length:906 start_codon:yes stop_codon:yes gene_type:complete